jgi:hypothetical protein
MAAAVVVAAAAVAVEEVMGAAMMEEEQEEVIPVQTQTCLIHTVSRLVRRSVPEHVKSLTGMALQVTVAVIVIGTAAKLRVL